MTSWSLGNEAGVLQLLAEDFVLSTRSVCQFTADESEATRFVGAMLVQLVARTNFSGTVTQKEANSSGGGERLWYDSVVSATGSRVIRRLFKHPAVSQPPGLHEKLRGS